MMGRSDWEAVAPSLCLPGARLSPGELLRAPALCESTESLPGWGWAWGNIAVRLLVLSSAATF